MNIFILIFGIVVGVLVYRLVILKNKYHGPNSRDIIKQKYHDRHGEYYLRPQVYLCPLSINN